MLKFILKKKSDGSTLEVGSFNEMAEGDAWVARITGPGTYGRNQDISVFESDLEAEGLLAANATSSEVSDQPKLDGEGNPVMDNQEPPQPVMQVLYHFAREWEVEVVDITQELVQQSKVQDRSKARQFCLSIVDEIAAINKDLNDPQLMATIFSTATFQGIILALLTGGTATARALMVQHGPSLYPQATVDSLVAKMDAYIASET
jgi:hypothetical protein